MYCDGEYKPKLRGILHYHSSFIIPPLGFCILLYRCNTLLKFVLSLNLSICLFLWVAHRLVRR